MKPFVLHSQADDWAFFLTRLRRHDDAARPMLTGDIRNQIDSIWSTFWAGGIANPLEVIEQITYLLFIKRLDELHTLEEAKANRLKLPMGRRVFPKGKDARERSYEDLSLVALQALRAARNVHAHCGACLSIPAHVGR